MYCSASDLFFDTNVYATQYRGRLSRVRRTSGEHYGVAVDVARAPCVFERHHQAQDPRSGSPE